MFIVCIDLEGVLIPEIWINVAIKTGIEELKITTRDEPDYDKLMKMRLKILKERKITLKIIQKVISEMQLLESAKDFLNWLRSITQVIIITDSYNEFTEPLKQKLGNATIFCHSLKVDENEIITDYILRVKDMKKITVQKFREMNFEVIAIGDSYNDISMLMEANYGILFRPPEAVIKKFPQFPVAFEYNELKEIISNHFR